MRNPFEGDLYPVFLALDPTLMVSKKDVALVPVSGERHPDNPVVRPGEPGSHAELRATHPSVRIESGRFCMWYCTLDGRFREYGGGPLSRYQASYTGSWLCYAESPDGLRWETPELGLVEYGGNRRNNIVGKGAVPAFLYDPDDPDPGRRYKCVFDWFDKDTPFSEYMGFSADGVHWTYDFTHYGYENMECPTLYRWGGEYRMLTQVFDPLVRTPDPGQMARRVNALFTSKDFKTWRRAPGIAFAIPHIDPMRPAHNMQAHMGSAVCPAGRFCLGIFGRFTPDPSQDHTPARVSFGLCLSDDGHHFYEPFWMFDLLPLPEDADAWDRNFLSQSANSLVEVGDEWWLYYGGSRGDNNSWGGYAAIGIACWRKHGFAYLTTLHEACLGTFATMEVDVPANAKGLTVNAVVPEEGSIKLRLVSDNRSSEGAVLAGVSPGWGPPPVPSDNRSCEGTVLVGDSVTQDVRWATPVDWISLAGRKVKFTFELAGQPHAVRLYSWEFQRREEA